MLLPVLISVLAAAGVRAACPDYADYSKEYHAPFSGGHYNLSSQRPVPACRTFVVDGVDETITRIGGIIKDPDLRQLFTNAYPNTLDTAVKWKGYAANDSTQELAFIITGDINAMWLRDSANQMQSYMPLLNASSSNTSLASLYRGVINLQARYLQEYPFCQSFQPPVESHVAPSVNGAADMDTVMPPYVNTTVFECKYELDSLAAFLEVSTDYYSRTKDSAFFAKYQWIDAVQTLLNVATAMRDVTTYQPNGNVSTSPYTFTRYTTSAEDTLDNSGNGNPEQSGTGLIRSAFRPSDDACIFQLFIPANAMFATQLAKAVEIVNAIGGHDALAKTMMDMSKSVRAAISQHGIVHSRHYGSIYAYEVDGYGSQNLMDDANIPSLLALPFLGYLPENDTVYQNTRAKILSSDDPYWSRGPVISAVGGPHDGPGHAWPMASIVRIFTSDNDTEIYSTLKDIVSSTDGYGLIHESIDSFNQSDWTRQWFSWANGLFGQMILDLEDRKPEILAMSFQ